MLFAFLAIAIFAPVLLKAWPPGTPAWAGGAIALAALFGALLVFWRSGALRAGFVLGFAAMLCLAAVAGWLTGCAASSARVNAPSMTLDAAYSGADRVHRARM